MLASAQAGCLSGFNGVPEDRWKDCCGAAEYQSLAMLAHRALQVEEAVDCKHEEAVEIRTCYACSWAWITSNRSVLHANHGGLLWTLCLQAESFTLCVPACSNVGSGVTAVLTDRDKLIAGVGGLSLLALGVYSAREGTRTAAQLFSR